MFARNARRNLDKIFLSYGDDISSFCNLRSFVTDMFFKMILSHMTLSCSCLLLFYVATGW